MIIFLVSSTVAYLFYSFFYFFSPSIWSMYTALPLESFTPWSRWTIQEEHDGIEMFVLYPMVLLIIAVSCFFYSIFSRKISKYPHFFLWICVAVCTVVYYRSIGFFLPWAAARAGAADVIFIAAAIVLAVFLDRSMGKGRVLKILAAVLLFVICMVPTRWFYMGFDYLYIFFPALRTWHGFALRESYVQYDHLISLLVLAWMKLKLPMGLFHLVGNFSFFVLLISLYCFAKKYFLHKGFAAYLVVALTIIRVYGDLFDVIEFPQGTPLRLDWWFLIVILGFWKDLRHWMVGLGLGSLMLFHHAFGMIYAMSYVLFVFILFILERLEQKNKWREDVQKYFRTYGTNFFILIISFSLYQAFLSPRLGTPAFDYFKYNIGFLPVKQQSFYWYVPVMLSCVAIYLWKNKPALSEKYFQTTVLLMVLAVGNSFYFFGRSDENNIIKISASLVLIFFTLLDLIHFELKGNLRHRNAHLFIPIVAVIVVGGIAYSYASRAVDRAKMQVSALLHGPYINMPDMPIDTQTISAATNGSPKVTFMSIRNDFDYYYASGIVPQNYYSFTNSWLIKKDYIDFLNAQLSEGYYLVMPVDEYVVFRTILKELKMEDAAQVSNYFIMKGYNEQTKL